MKHALAIQGTPGATVRLAVTDVAQWLLPTIAANLNNRRVVGALITVEANTVRCAMGNTVPTQGALQVGHQLLATAAMQLSSPVAVISFQVINDVFGVNGVIQVTPQYEV